MNIYSKNQQTVGGIAQARHMERGREKRIEKRGGARECGREGERWREYEGVRGREERGINRER